MKYNEPAAGVDQASINAAAASLLALNPKPDYLVGHHQRLHRRCPQGADPLPTSGTPTTKIIMADGAKNDNTLKLSGTAYGSYNMAMVNAHLARISGTAPTVDTANQTKTGAYQKFVDDYKTRWNQQDPASASFRRMATTRSLRWRWPLAPPDPT